MRRACNRKANLDYRVVRSIMLLDGLFVQIIKNPINLSRIINYAVKHPLSDLPISDQRSLGLAKLRNVNQCIMTIPNRIIVHLLDEKFCVQEPRPQISSSFHLLFMYLFVC